MPTLIAVDASLSMLKPVGNNFDPEILDDDIPTKRTLAIEVINQFTDHVSAHCKLEFVSLMTFSSTAVVERSFTRELILIRESALAMPTHDITNFDAFLTGVSKLVVDTWGSTVPVQILLITDGSIGFGPGSLRDVVRTGKRLPFSAKMNILTLCDPEDKNFSESCRMLEQLIDITCGEGCLYVPETHLSSRECKMAVEKLCAKEFTPYKGTIKCGNLSSKITLCPPPQPCVSKEDEKRYEIGETIEMLGFIEVNDLASPPVHSRHLLLPLKSAGVEGKSSRADESDESDGNVANFCVLLHGALKVATEHYCAICEVGQDWYGFIHAFSDSKQKSNLILYILPPGTNVIPWLGNLQQLGPKDDFVPKKTTHGEVPAPSFPVKSVDKKSYIATPVQTTVWLSTGGLNSDIQKLLRHARKLPEKTVQFYKELNRMRRWALALGFESILETIALVLERECISTSHPEASIQLTHAASQLQTQSAYSFTITHHVAK